MMGLRLDILCVGRLSRIVIHGLDLDIHLLFQEQEIRQWCILFLAIKSSE